VNISNIRDRAKFELKTLGKSTRPIGRQAANALCLGFPAVFLLGTTALEIYQPGYNRLTSTISELVWGPAGWLENILFLVFAITLALFALRLRTAFIPLAAASLGFVLIAIFPTRAIGGEITMISLIHEYSAQGIALALPAACFLLAKKLDNNEKHRFLVTCSITAGVIGIAVNICGFLALHNESAWVGAAERLIVLNGLFWLQLAGIHLWLLQKDTTTAQPPKHYRSSRFSTAPCPAANPVSTAATVQNDTSRWY